MALTTPYQFHHYIGEHASTSAAATFFTDTLGWGSLANGIIFYDTSDKKLKGYFNNGWEILWSASASLDHGALGGLADDDHTQYLLATGGRALSADWAVGSKKITGLLAPTVDSGAATKGYVDQAVAGLHWQESVKSIATDIPGGPSAGDRYIIAGVNSWDIHDVNTGAKKFLLDGDVTTYFEAGYIIKVKGSTGNNNWYTVVSATYVDPHTEILVSEVIPSAVVDGKIWLTAGTQWHVIGVDKIAEYDGADWVGYTPHEGWALWVDALDKAYVFTDALLWVAFASAFNHNDLAGLDGGTTGQYYHLTSAQHSGLTGGNDYSGHKHDDRYYTETELNAGQLDNRYYTETEIGSTTAASEGAKLVGTDTKPNLNSATTVEVALTHLDGQNPAKRSSAAGNPNGVVTGVAGDVYVDTTAGVCYMFKAAGPANNAWIVL